MTLYKDYLHLLAFINQQLDTLEEIILWQQIWQEISISPPSSDEAVTK